MSRQCQGTDPRPGDARPRAVRRRRADRGVRRAARALETETTATEFYDRICEAICRLTTMRRAAIFLADLGRRRVRAVGAHGTSFSQLAALRPTLLGHPDRPAGAARGQRVVVSERIEEAVPPEYARCSGSPRSCARR
jgi:hypothetical protein